MKRQKLPSKLSALLGAALVCGLIPSGTLKATVLPSNLTDTGSASLGDGYDSVFKDKKQGCIMTQGTEIKEVNQTVGGTLYFSRNMSLENIVNKLELGPNFNVSTSFLNLKLTSHFVNNHAATDNSSTFHFFWRGTAKTRTLGHSSVLPDIPPADQIQHIDGEDASQLDTLSHYRSFCGDEYVSEIKYGAYVLVTLKIVFVSTSDKREFDSEINLKPGAVSFNGKGSSASGSGEASSSKGKGIDPQGIQGKLLELARNKDLKTSSVEVVINQLGGDPTRMSDILGDDAINGRQVLECTGINIEDCVNGFGNGVKYARGFLESLKAKMDKGSSRSVANEWVPMGYVTTPYASVSSLGTSSLSLLNNPKIVSGKLLRQVDEIDSFLDEAVKIERKAQGLLEAVDSDYYTISESTIARIEEIQSKAARVKKEIRNLYERCRFEVLSCSEYVEEFQQVYPFPYTLGIDRAYLRLVPGEGELIQSEILAGGSGGSEFDHTALLNSPEDREVNMIEMHVDGTPTFLKLKLDDDTELNAGYSKGASESHSPIVYTDMFGIGHYIPATSASLVKKLVLGPGEFITYVEAHSKKVSGKDRVSYLRICKSDNHDLPERVCIEGGEKTGNKSSRVISSSSRLLGFYGREGKAIDRLGLVLYQRPQLDPSW